MTHRADRTNERTIIERSTPADHFTIIPNALIRDGRLSRFARSVLAEILSNDTGWRNSADDMWRRGRGERRRGEGRDAYRNAFRELEAAGYLTRSRMQDPDGTWYTTLYFRATATATATPPTPELPVLGATSGNTTSSQVTPTPDSPVVGSPVVGESGVIREVPLRRNTKEGSSDHGSTPSSPIGPTQTAAHSQASAPDDDTKIQAVKQAVWQVYKDSIEDEDALRIWQRFLGDRVTSKPVNDPVRYLGKIFNDTPHIDSLLSNCPYLDDEIHCPGCGGALMDQPLTASGLCPWCDRDAELRESVVNGETKYCARCLLSEPPKQIPAYPDSGLCAWCEAELSDRKENAV